MLLETQNKDYYKNLITNYYKTYNSFLLPFFRSKRKVNLDKDHLDKIYKFLNYALERGYKINDFSLLLYANEDELNDLINYFEGLNKSLNLYGFYFRKKFGKTSNLEKYTQEDYLAILAQYSITYNWKSEYENVFQTNPENIIQDYFSDANLEKTKYNTSIKKLKIHSFDEMLDNIILSFTKNSVFTKQERDFILNSGLALGVDIKDIIEKQKLHIEIQEKLGVLLVGILLGRKETQYNSYKKIYDLLGDDFILNYVNPNVLLSVLFLLGDFYKFNRTTDDYSFGMKNKLYFGTFKNIKKLEFKLINKILEIILDKEKNLKLLLQNKQVWKGFYHYMKAGKKGTKSSKLKEILYEKEFKFDDPNYLFGKYMAEGRFDLALDVVLKYNLVGIFVRNIATFLRYDINNHYRGYYKSKKLKKSTKLFDYTCCDINSNLEKIEKLLFYLNNRLLLNLKSFLESYPYTDTSKINERKVQNVKIKYQNPFWGIPHTDINKILKIVDKVVIEKVGKSLKEKNISLAVDETFMSLEEIGKIRINFSGRNVNKQLGMFYAENGSMLNIEKLVKMYLKGRKTEVKPNFVESFFGIGAKDKNFLRLGIMWKSLSNYVSIDLDLSNYLIYENGKTESIYYGNPELDVAVSSGDITTSNIKTYSNEFIDLDLDKFKEKGGKYIISFVNVFSGNKNQIEAYFFIDLVNGKERIMPGNIIKINIDKLLFTSALDLSSRGVIPVIFDIQTNQMILLNYLENMGEFSNIETFVNRFKNDPDKILNSILQEVYTKTVGLDILKNFLIKDKANTIIGVFEDEKSMKEKYSNQDIINPLTLNGINKIKEILF